MQLSDRESPQRAAVVTGAAGWLGQNLVRALAAQGRTVRRLVHDADDAPLLEVINPQVEVVVGDVRDPVVARRALRRHRRASRSSTPPR